MHGHYDPGRCAARRWLEAEVHPRRLSRPRMATKQFGERLEVQIWGRVQALCDDLSIARGDMHQRMAQWVDAGRAEFLMLKQAIEQDSDLVCRAWMFDKSW
jgi:hypothetical protein